MIDLLKVTKEEFDKATYKFNGQNEKARLEVSPQRRRLTRAQALFFKGFEEMKGDESKVWTFHRKLQISCYVEREIAANYACDGERRTDEGSVIGMHVVSTTGKDFNDALFETMVKSSWHPNRIAGLSSKDQSGSLQMISVNINRQRSADISVIVEKLVRPARARTSACHLLHSRNEILGRTRLTKNCLGFCVLWWQTWARHDDGFGLIFQM